MQLESYRQIMALMRELPRIEITAHRRPEYVGQIHKVTLPAKWGFYHVVDGCLEHEVSRRHHGKGSELWIVGSYHIRCEGDVCEVHDSRRNYDEGDLIMGFRILEDEKLVEES